MAQLLKDKNNTNVIEFSKASYNLCNLLELGLSNLIWTAFIKFGFNECGCEMGKSNILQTAQLLIHSTDMIYT